MIDLGISIYPDKSNLEDDLKYIDLGAKYGVTRIFTNLLGLGDKPINEIVEEFSKRISHAHKHNIEVIVDVSPSVLEELKIPHDDLSFFNDIGADGIRMDEALDGHKEALMSHNHYGLKIEVNASGNVSQIENILAFHPNRNKVGASHNFYPQRYTGLDLDYFIKNSEKVRALNISQSTFVSSNNRDAFGPWDLNEGLPTLEMHRDLPIDLQARHLVATNLIDNISISNCYASEEEFISLANIVSNKVNIKLDLEYELSDIEKTILYYPEHFVRGDISKYMRRSTMTRVHFANRSITPNNTRDLKRGDVVILNNEYGRYKGELHIVLEDLVNEGNKNVVGRVKEEEMFMLEFLDSWSHFVILE